MSLDPSRIIKTIRRTGRGSDYLGNCECGGKHMSEAFVAQSRREYQRASGKVDSSPIGGGTYGHESCLEEKFGPLTNAARGASHAA